MFCNDLWALAFSSDIHRARRLNRTGIWQNHALLQQEITQNWQKETFPSLTHKTRSRHLLISPSTKSKKLQTLVYELQFIHILARKEDAQTLDYANEKTPQRRITWIKLRRLHLHCQSWGTLLTHATYTRMERNTYIFWFCFKSSETRIARELETGFFWEMIRDMKEKARGRFLLRDAKSNKSRPLPWIVDFLWADQREEEQQRQTTTTSITGLGCCLQGALVWTSPSRGVKTTNLKDRASQLWLHTVFEFKGRLILLACRVKMGLSLTVSSF
jgi:hypothetical protein